MSRGSDDKERYAAKRDQDIGQITMWPKLPMYVIEFNHPFGLAECLFETGA